MKLTIDLEVGAIGECSAHGLIKGIEENIAAQQAMIDDPRNEKHKTVLADTLSILRGIRRKLRQGKGFY